ncbi:hypothetical protein E2L06_16025 [Haloterrigena sp. H1]|uniref:hypothetical protein n=1 Tax=Haloterrigena sp. H1 TaxID=2552943 RepID=UPI00110D49C3|nr:hypothetical protein [Haloterrigena sp. H1]TMT81483.1 hypothetical protein E2L06_16025 [Haloterrigena sp. H1]
MKDKWKYLYGGIMFFVLTAVTVGYSFYDIGLLIPVVGLIVCFGISLIMLRPLMYGYVMIGFGVMLLALVAVLILGESSLLIRGLTAIIGIGAIIRGLQAQRAIAAK